MSCATSLTQLDEPLIRLKTLYFTWIFSRHTYYIRLQKSLEIDPDYYEVYFNLGNLVSDEGDYEAAADLYARSEFPLTLR